VNLTGGLRDGNRELDGRGVPDEQGAMSRNQTKGWRHGGMGDGNGV